MNKYTKQIEYKEYSPALKIWYTKTMYTTDETVYIWLRALSINRNVKDVIVTNL